MTIKVCEVTSPHHHSAALATASLFRWSEGEERAEVASLSFLHHFHSLLMFTQFSPFSLPPYSSLSPSPPPLTLLPFIHTFHSLPLCPSLSHISECCRTCGNGVTATQRLSGGGILFENLLKPLSLSGACLSLSQ